MNFKSTVCQLMYVSLESSEGDTPQTVTVKPVTVDMNDESIFITYKEGDVVNWEGFKTKEGYYSLKVTSHIGDHRARIHTAYNSRGELVLEGYYLEDGYEGFWIISETKTLI